MQGSCWIGLKSFVLKESNGPFSSCYNDRWTDLQKRISAYRRELRDLGIRDYQVPGLDREMAITDKDKSEEVITDMRIGYRIVHLLVLILLSAIPNIFLNLPVRLAADIYAERRRQKALKKSKVKIYGEYLCELCSGILHLPCLRDF